MAETERPATGVRHMSLADARSYGQELKYVLDNPEDSPVILSEQEINDAKFLLKEIKKYLADNDEAL